MAWPVGHGGAAHRTPCKNSAISTYPVQPGTGPMQMQAILLNSQSGSQQDPLESMGSYRSAFRLLGMVDCHWAWRMVAGLAVSWSFIGWVVRVFVDTKDFVPGW